MKIKYQQLMTTLLGILAMSCTQAQNPTNTQESDLSTISIIAPSEEQLRQVYGPNCEKLRFSADSPEIKSLAMQTFDRCVAAKLLLSEYRISINPTKCDQGVTGTVVREQTGPFSKAIEMKLKKGCEYLIKVEIGSKNTYYLSNQSGESLDKSRLLTSPVRFTANIFSSEAGVKLGFPGKDSDPGLPLPNPNPNPNPDAEPPTLRIPLDWTGLDNRGDEMWKIEKKTK
jgi:hypothetical protein